MAQDHTYSITSPASLHLALHHIALLLFTSLLISFLRLDINVAMAVAIDGGLLTPTIIKAQNQDLFSISRNWKDLVDRAKVKKLTPAESTSGRLILM